MKTSIVFPCFDKAQYFKTTLDSWLERENLPDEILILEDYNEGIPPEKRMLPVVNGYAWPSDVAVRYFQRDKTLRAIYPDKEEAMEKSYVQYGCLISIDRISEIWESGGSLIGNGAQAKNFGPKLASGDTIIITDPENIQEVDVIEIARRRLTNKNALYASEVYHCEPNERKRGEFWFRDKHYCYNIIIEKDNFIKIGGFDEMFGAQWGWEDEAFALTLKRHGIEIVYPPRMVVLHQKHGSRVRVDHNKEATKAYKDLPPGPWVANEGRGWTDWGNSDGWQEIPTDLKRSS